MMATSAENPGAAKNRLLRSKNTAAINTVSGAPTSINSYWDYSLPVLRHQSPKCTNSETAFEAPKLGQVLGKRELPQFPTKMSDQKFAKNGIRDRNVMSSWAGAHLAHEAGEERDWQWSESPIPRFREICVRGKTVCPRPIEAAAKAQADTGISSRLPVVPVASYRSFLAPPTSPYNPLALLTHSRQLHSMEERGFIVHWAYLSFIQHINFIHPT